MPTKKIVKGDITLDSTDAIASMVNESLWGAAVDGFIHRVAGPALLHADQ